MKTVKRQLDADIASEFDLSHWMLICIGSELAVHYISPVQSKPSVQAVTISVATAQTVSGLFQAAANARACYVMAHGAGAGMKHPFLASMAGGFVERGISTLRFQFPYMEAGLKRTDTPAVAHAAVRAAVAEAANLAPGLPLFAGGKSFGGRMTSQAQAEAPVPGVRGLIFLGFPLHPPGKPSDERAKHLFEVRIPMLFLQGSKDEFAQLDFLEPVVARLAERATLKLFPEADHSFHSPKSSGRSDAQTQTELLDCAASWIDTVVSKRL